MPQNAYGSTHAAYIYLSNINNKLSIYFRNYLKIKKDTSLKNITDK